MTEKMPTGHGGYRPGAGRKKGSTNTPTAAKQSSLDLYNDSRAKKEKHLAELAEIEVAVKRGELIPADAVQTHWEQMAAKSREFIKSSEVEFFIKSSCHPTTVGCDTSTFPAGWPQA